MEFQEEEEEKVEKKKNHGNIKFQTKSNNEKSIMRGLEKKILILNLNDDPPRGSVLYKDLHDEVQQKNELNQFSLSKALKSIPSIWTWYN